MFFALGVTFLLQTNGLTGLEALPIDIPAPLCYTYYVAVKYVNICCGGVSEWLKVAVLKTAERKLRGFESYLLRQ